MADVLIVEDDDAVVELLSVMVERLGHDVRTAGSAEDALLRVAEGRPDLMLLDLGLPGRAGDELVALLARGLGRPRSLIVVSALPQAQVHAVAARHGARHLHKPFSIADFEAAVTDALDEVLADLAALPPGPVPPGDDHGVLIRTEDPPALSEAREP